MNEHRGYNRNIWRKNYVETAKECYVLYRSNIPPNSNCKASCLPSPRPSMEDKQDMRDTLGEVRMNPLAIWLCHFWPINKKLHLLYETVDMVWRTYQKGWMIGTDEGNFLLSAWVNDIYITLPHRG